MWGREEQKCRWCQTNSVSKQKLQASFIKMWWWILYCHQMEYFSKWCCYEVAFRECLSRAILWPALHWKSHCSLFLWSHCKEITEVIAMKNAHDELLKWCLCFSAEPRKIQVIVDGHSTFDNQISSLSVHLCPPEFWNTLGINLDLNL